MAVPVVAAATALSPVAQRAFTWASKNIPEVAAKAQAYLADSSKGAPVDRLAASKSPSTQQAVVKALLESGMSAANFVEAAQLTAKEAQMYAQMIASYMVKQTEAVDKAQVAKPTTGNSYLDTVAVNTEIEEICKFLAISSDQYAKLVRGVNSHTSADVEMFQLGRKVEKRPYI